MANIESVLSHAEEHCLAHGIRLTPKRKQVLYELVKAQKALSAYDVIDEIKREFDEVLQPMSIYRILEFLTENQLIHKLSTANKFIACSHITCNHTHEVPQFLICGSCHRVSEINIDKALMSTLKKNIQLKGFKLVSPQLEMSCLCNDCATSVSST
ncbi:MAG: transcriptional repressor [Proteobacteria bacterium]|nr:transcriptional repressor [Pseudomonadota bacterium]MDA1331396.1 transcriptional repressor [Pseudomonadota bacterium]